MGKLMKLWAIAGLLASAFLLTALVRHKEQRVKVTVKDPDTRYSIDEFLSDLDD